MDLVTVLGAPALPLDEAGKYVVAAYLVFLALILIYVVIMAIRLTHLEREALELIELMEKKQAESEGSDDKADVKVEESVV